MTSPDEVVERAERLLARAEEDGEPAYASEAVALFEAVASYDHDDPEWRSYCLTELGNALVTRWRLTRQASGEAGTTDLEHATAVLDRAVQYTDPWPERSLWRHTVRVTAATELYIHEPWVPTTPGEAPSILDTRRVLAEAYQQWQDAEGTAPEQRAYLAVALALGETQVYMDDQGADLARARELSAYVRQARGWLPADLVDLVNGMVGALSHWENGSLYTDDESQTLLLSAQSSRNPAIAETAYRCAAFMSWTRSHGGGDLRGKEAYAQAGVAGLPTELPAGLLDPAAGTEAWERLGRPFRQYFEIMSAHLSAVGGVPPDHLLPQVLADLAPTGRRHPAAVSRSLLFIAAAAAIAVSMRHRGLLAACVAHVDSLAQQLPHEHELRLGLLLLGAHAEGALSALDGGARARAAARYDAVLPLLSTTHPLYAETALSAARCYRHAARSACRARELGLASLTASRWSVLLQSGTEDAMTAAHDVAATAREVAGWCLSDGHADPAAYDDLIAALDAGRGVTLYTAVRQRQVPDLLLEAGHHGLAEEWRRTRGHGRDRQTSEALGLTRRLGEYPDDLRLRAMQALAGHPRSAAALLQQTTTAEIRQALAATGMDALVFLLAGTGQAPGTALVVPATGAVAPIRLPRLHSVHKELIDSFAAAADQATRDAGEVGETAPAEDRFPVQTVALCRWAWSVAMRSVVDHARQWRLGRPARLVLVPVGALGRVPWHAAAGTDERTGQYRYAVQDLVCSYTPSARLFCLAAARESRPVVSSLVVGDPAGDLRFAGIEAQAIASRFYPRGQYFGRHGFPCAPAGTPEQVLEWVRRAAGPCLLHFACHGRVVPGRPGEADLMLAGGSLPAQDLLEASRAAALPLERVFLAACTTSVTTAVYDEAFSLATAFLAAGARGVLGALWRVPDSATSLLMYMVHHYTEVESFSLVDALHRAQQWMLDPQREPPAGMSPELVPYCADASLAHPVAWAGFTHQGV